MNRDEHGQARVGRITGSRVRDILYGGANVLERLRRDIQENKFYDVGPNTPLPLKWGKSYERQAQALFWEKHPELEVEDRAFVPYWDQSHALFGKGLGVSPDKIIVDDAGNIIGGLETKSPYVAGIHQGYIKAGVCPKEYIPQVQLSIFNCNTPDWWFASFDPRETSDHYRYFEVLVKRDDAMQELIQKRCTYFLERYISGEPFATTDRITAFKSAF